MMKKISCSVFLGVLVAGMQPLPAMDELTPVTDPQPPGALSGASVFVSPGHGWFISSRGSWTTQRGVSHGLIEDHSNGEAVFQYLVPYLWNAGARVYTTRERDMNTNMVILEAGKSRDVTLDGAWSVWRGASTWDGDCYWVPTGTEKSTASAEFVPVIPEDGYYSVYAWYRTAPPVARNSEGRLPTMADAEFVINHTGGQTIWKQDLAKDGGTWTYLGHYWFEKGKNAEIGSVTVSNKSAGPESALVIDAIRFGGGMGDTLVDGRPSGKPRWEESGMFYAPFMGYSPEGDTRPYNSVSALPMWAEWECEDWELGKSIYVSWHTNASNGKTRGMSSFIYGPNAWSGIEDFLGFPEGIALQSFVHDEVMRDVRGGFDEKWPDYGKITRWLGETNPRNNNRMPAALFEYGFHDNAEDAGYILDPRFRSIAARATMQGIVDFYSNQMEGFDNGTHLPEVPTNFSAVVDGEAVVLSWAAPPADSGNGVLGDAATIYRVMTSRNGKGFDNGGLTEKTSVRVAAPPPGETRFYRLAARNAGGESMPTETLAVRTPREGESRVLIVNGFDRLDGRMNLVEANGAQRGFLDRMNSRDYTIQHGTALARNNVAFDSTSNEAVTEEMLARYGAVVWILGQESGASEALSAGEMKLLRKRVADGGALLISGSEWARDLATTEEGKSFLSETLGIANAQEVTGSGDVRPLMGAEAFTQFPPLPFETTTTGRVYPVVRASGLEPMPGGKALLQFGEAGPAAAVASEKTGRTVALGVPFEALTDEDQRVNLMAALLDYLVNGRVGQGASGG